MPLTMRQTHATETTNINKLHKFKYRLACENKTENLNIREVMEKQSGATTAGKNTCRLDNRSPSYLNVSAICRKDL